MLAIFDAVFFSLEFNKRVSGTKRDVSFEHSDTAQYTLLVQWFDSNIIIMVRRSSRTGTPVMLLYIFGALTNPLRRVVVVSLAAK